MKWTYCCLLLTILLLPWYIIRWQVGGIPTTLLEVAALITLVVGMVEWWHSGRCLADIKLVSHQYRWGLVWTGLFLVASTVAVVVSPDHRQALGAFKAYIVEPIGIGWLAVKVIGSDRRRWWGVMVALIMAGLEVVAVGVSQFIFRWPNLAPAEMAQGRISSFYNSANRIGLFLGPMMAIGGAMVAGKVAPKRTIWLLLAVLSIVMIVALSRSRGALVGVGAVGAALLLFWCVQRWAGWLFSYNRWWKLIMTLVLVIYVAGSLGFVWFINHPPVVANPYTRPGFTTFTVRQCVWQGTKAMLSQQPVFGAGLAGFTTTYLKHITCDAEPLEDPHMLVLNFWSETGLLGLVAIFGLMAWWWWQAYRLISDPRARWLGIGLAIALLYYLVHGLDDIPYFRNDLSMEWWLLIGLVVASNRVWLPLKITAA